MQNLREQLAEVSGDTDLHLAVLRAKVGDEPARIGEHVTVLLSVGLNDEAWDDAQLHLDRLARPLLLDLLGARRATHPGDVVPHDRALIEAQIVNAADKRRYQRAVELLPRLREAYRALGRPTDFDEHVQSLRAKHQVRPSFLDHLHNAGY